MKDISIIFQYSSDLTIKNFQILKVNKKPIKGRCSIRKHDRVQFFKKR